MVEWECLLTGTTFEELVATGEPRIVAGEDAEADVVFALSARLLTALASSHSNRLKELAKEWVRERAEDGEPLELDTTEAMLSDLALLARSAVQQGVGLYCWVA